MTEEQEKLVLENKGLIGFVIKKMGLGYKYEELVDVLIIDLIESVKSFDSKKGIKPSTFLTLCITNRTINYLRNSKAKKRGRDYQTMSLDQEICIGNNNVYISDLIADERINIEEEIIKREQFKGIKESIKKLKEKERYILIHKFEINGAKKLTEREIAKDLNISHSQVNYRLHKALEKIRKDIS